MKEKKHVFNQTQAVILYLIVTVAFQMAGMKINGLFYGSEDISLYVDKGSKILGVILILEMILLIRFTPMKISWSAVKGNKDELKKSLPISAAISLLIILGLIGFRLYMNSKNPIYKEIPMFGLYLKLHMRWLYPFSIVFQELFIKAFTQDNIRTLIEEAGDGPSKKNEKKTVLLTSLVTAMFFFTLHVQYPLYYMTGAFVLCFVTGIIYEKDRNIWGAVMVHFALGFLPRCFGVLQIIEG